MTTKRRGYGEGSIYQRCDSPTCPPLVDGPPHPTSGKPTRVRPEHKCEGRWVGTFEAGWTREGTRRRIPVTAKSRAEVVRKLAKRRADVDRYGDTEWNPRTTVKQWVETYLERRMLPPKPLSPKGWKAAAQPLRRWVVPAIGHRRVIDLTPGDVRKVAKAQYDATSIRGGELSLSTVDATQRALMTCLRHAKADGASISDNVFLVERPGMGKSDRLPLSLAETLRCLAVASTIPSGLRWAFALLYGARQGEMLGLVTNDPLDGHPLIDVEAGVIRLEWQLQQLDYLDPRQKTRGFKVPRDYEAVHLTKRFHLVRPKTRAGYREVPLFDEDGEMLPTTVALLSWLDRRPANPWGLVFPTAAGMPVDDKVDREEWYAIQETATVDGLPDLPPVHHPSGKRWYYVHECRNFAATELDEVGATDNVSMSLIGHATKRTLRGYQKARLQPKAKAIAAISARLQLDGGAAQ